MKIISRSLFAVIVLSFGFTFRQESNVEFVCFKKHKASNTCHFNFKVDGVPYRYVDMGCKYEAKKNDLIERAQNGDLAMAKDWKIECPQPKPEADKASAPSGF